MAYCVEIQSQYEACSLFILVYVLGGADILSSLLHIHILPGYANLICWRCMYYMYCLKIVKWSWIASYSCIKNNSVYNEMNLLITNWYTHDLVAYTS